MFVLGEKEVKKRVIWPLLCEEGLGLKIKGLREAVWFNIISVYFFVVEVFILFSLFWE